MTKIVLESYEKIDGKAQPDENAPSARKNSPRLEILLPDPVESFRRVETFRGTYSDVTSQPFAQQTPNSRRDRSD